MKYVLIIITLCFLAFYGYQKFQAKETTTTFTSTDYDDIAPTYNTAYESVPEATASITSLNTKSYTCDGRMHCSQMTSCEEATYFINHCPNIKMDGNNDGIPCEKQWCK